MILYLHGFRSSPQSFKAQVMQRHMQELGRAKELICPQLPASPSAAMRLAHDLIEPTQRHELTIIGSSLGGYYATYLAEQWSCQALVINPAVKAPADLEQYIGVTTNYHNDEVFEFKREYLDELAVLAVPKISQTSRYFLIAATGDEVLDWRDMVQHYEGAQQFVIEGSDHGVSEFENYVEMVMAFCDRNYAS